MVIKHKRNKNKKGIENMTNTDEKEQECLLRERDTAEILSIAVTTLRQWRHRKPMIGPPFVKINGKMVRYRLSDVQNWIRGLS